MGPHGAVQDIIYLSFYHWGFVLLHMNLWKSWIFNFSSQFFILTFCYWSLSNNKYKYWSRWTNLIVFWSSLIFTDLWAELKYDMFGLIFLAKLTPKFTSCWLSSMQLHNYGHTSILLANNKCCTKQNQSLEKQKTFLTFMAPHHMTPGGKISLAQRHLIAC